MTTEQGVALIVALNFSPCAGMQNIALQLAAFNSISADPCAAKSFMI